MELLTDGEKEADSDSVGADLSTLSKEKAPSGVITEPSIIRHASFNTHQMLHADKVVKGPACTGALIYSGW